ncbi:uncharacterized protein CDAR_121821 [Caerostris darwini]|uniref:Odorant receptor n=1 Tax=Caerostris darwini TaxID=1538125 RepID=A0AAV4UFT6_9ARAC|nr:uncharacterized protein CDAR_121821 [Caerostris darwini]
MKNQVMKFIPSLLLSGLRLTNKMPKYLKMEHDYLSTNLAWFEAVNYSLQYFLVGYELEYKNAVSEAFKSPAFMMCKRRFTITIGSLCLKLCEDPTFFSFLLTCGFVSNVIAYCFQKTKCYRVFEASCKCMIFIFQRRFFEFFNISGGLEALWSYCDGINTSILQSQHERKVIDVLSTYDNITRDAKSLLNSCKIIDENEKFVLSAYELLFMCPTDCEKALCSSFEFLLCEIPVSFFGELKHEFQAGMEKVVETSEVSERDRENISGKDSISSSASLQNVSSSEGLRRSSGINSGIPLEFLMPSTSHGVTYERLPPSPNESITEPLSTLNQDEITEPKCHLNQEKITEPEIHLKRDEITQTEIYWKRDEITEPEIHSKLDEITQTEIHLNRDEITQTESHLKRDEITQTEIYWNRDEITEPEIHSKLDEITQTEIHLKRDEITQTEIHLKRDKITQTESHSKRDEIADLESYLKWNIIFKALAHTNLISVIEPVSPLNRAAVIQPVSPLNRAAVIQPVSPLNRAAVIQPVSP